MATEASKPKANGIYSKERGCGVRARDYVRVDGGEF
jgi:hypothetical protein